MLPYTLTPQLGKCKQGDLNYPGAKLQNGICLEKSPKGGFGFWPMVYKLTRELLTFVLVNFEENLFSKLRDVLVEY